MRRLVLVALIWILACSFLFAQPEWHSKDYGKIKRKFEFGIHYAPFLCSSAQIFYETGPEVLKPNLCLGWSTGFSFNYFTRDFKNSFEFAFSGGLEPFERYMILDYDLLHYLVNANNTSEYWIKRDLHRGMLHFQQEFRYKRYFTLKQSALLLIGGINYLSVNGMGKNYHYDASFDTNNIAYIKVNYFHNEDPVVYFRPAFQFGTGYRVHMFKYAVLEFQLTFNYVPEIYLFGTIETVSVSDFQIKAYFYHEPSFIKLSANLYLNTFKKIK